MPPELAPGIIDMDSKLFPTWLADKVLLAYRRKTCVEATTTTDYTAQLAKGGRTVTITGIPKITISDYIQGAPGEVQQLDPSSIELTIDKRKKWAFPIFDVDQRQATLKDYWNQVSQQAGMDLGENVEENYFADIVDDCDPANIGPSAGKHGDYDLGDVNAAVEVDKANIADTLMLPGGVLDEQDVDEAERYLIISPYYAQLYKMSDLGKVYVTGDRTSPMRNGILGPLDRFKVYVSNRLPTYVDTGGKRVTQCIYGQKSAIVFYTQMNKTKKIQGKDPFSDEVHGLQVYGYKAIRPKGFGVLRLTPKAA
jgi:hypothetical protein